jgi:hypothetical protein
MQQQKLPLQVQLALRFVSAPPRVVARMQALYPELIWFEWCS